MRKFIISALVFVLLFSLAAPNLSAAEEAEPPFNATESITLDGVEYKNVAKGKGYESTGARYGNQKWTDTGDDNKPLGKLTDGVVAEKGDADTIGCYQSGETKITIDLGNTYSIKRMVTDLYGNAPWGIPDPGEATVSVSVSTDNTTFNDVGNAQMSDEIGKEGWKLRLFTLTLNETVSARYVRVTYKVKGNFTWSSEIAVFGIEQTSNNSSSSSSSTPASSSSSSSSSASSPASSSSSSSSAAPSSASSGAKASSSSTTSTSNPKTGDESVYAIAVIGFAALASTMLVIRKRKTVK